MNTKSILVDIDETTKHVMSSINSDITTEIRNAIGSDLSTISDIIEGNISELHRKMVSMSQEAKQQNEKRLKTLNDIQNEVEDIFDLVSSLQNIDEFGKVASDLTSTSESLKSDLAVITTLRDLIQKSLYDIQNEAEQSNEYAKQISSQIIVLQESLSRDLEELTKFNEESFVESTAKIDSMDDRMHSRLDAMEGRIEKLGINQTEMSSAFGARLEKGLKTISTSIAEESVRISESDRIENSRMHSRLDAMEDRIKKLGINQTEMSSAFGARLEQGLKAISTSIAEESVRISESDRIENSRMHSRLDAMEDRIEKLDARLTNIAFELGSKLDQGFKDIAESIAVAVTRIGELDKSSELRDQESKTILENILYAVTPFWKKNKLKK